MRSPFFCLIALLLHVVPADAQPRRAVATTTPLPEFSLTRAETESHLRFLAADELMGRRTGEPGNLVAARYIAEQFRALGLKKPAGPGTSDYYQTVPLLMVKPATSGLILTGRDTLRSGNQFVVIAGGNTDLTAPLVYAGYGLSDGEDGYKGQDVKGKIVVTQVGSAEAKSPREVIAAMQTKRKMAAEKGAAGLIELVTGAGLPWGMANRYFGGESLSLLPAGENPAKLPLLHIWVDNGKNQLATLKEPGQSITIRTSGRPQTVVNAVNVVGLVEGSDPKLKEEYVLLTAHFDHIGTLHKGVPGADTTYNGARDNAMGTVALLDAAKALQAKPPKRSVLIVALTGEEVGLLGSRFYAEHPLVPLKQTIFDLNIDGAGYNDTTLVSVIGLERTGAKAEIDQACKAFGLTTFNDPAPEQGLFDRSDNVSFAAKGVPSPTFSPGFKTFDEAIQRYYHQVSDNPETINFAYLLKFCQAYTYATRLIADKTTRPQWSPGDKYEAAGKALYGR